MIADAFSFGLGSLTGAVSAIFSQAQNVAIGEGYPAKLREMRRRAVNAIAGSLALRPPAPSANADLARALVLAWCDVARAWLKDCEALAEAELRGNDAAEIARFVAAARSHIGRLGDDASTRGAPLAHDPFAGCLDAVSRASSEAVAEPGWFADVTHRIAQAARDDILRAQLDPPQAAVARLMRTVQDGDETIAVTGCTILDTFVEVLKSGAFPEATLAFHIHAAGAIRAELDAIRTDLAAVGLDLAARVDAIGDRVDWISEHAARIDGRLAEHTDALKRIEARMRRRMPLPLRLTFGTISERGFDRFSYLNPRIPFIGREDELQALHSFFTVDSRELKWWALCGDGGVGKSRLALEYCQRLVRSGTADAGFLRRGAAVDKVALESWQPERPTFIVIDYAASRSNEARDVLAALSTRELAHPVRVLLIERTADERFVATITGASQSEGAALRGKLYPTAGVMEPLSLATPDDPDALVWFGRFGWRLEAASERPLAAALEPAPFLELLERADPGRRRPLVALVLGWRLAIDEGLVADGLIELLDGWLASELLRWPADLFASEPQALATLRPEARRALVLATLVDGLSKDELAAHAATLAADKASLSAQWPALRQVAGGDDGGLRSLAPDLLAEFFVLEARLPRSQADTPFDVEPADDDLRRIAWRTRDGEATRAFAYRAVRDLGTHPAAEGLAQLEEGVAKSYWLNHQLQLLRRVPDEDFDAVLLADVDDYLGRDNAAALLVAAEIVTFRTTLYIDSTSAEPLFQRLRRMKTIGRDNHDIRHQWAKAVANVVPHRAAEEPQLACNMIAELRDAGSDDRDIRLEWARSVNNYIHAIDGKEPQPARGMIAELRDAGSNDRDIRHMWARCVMMYVGRHAAEEPQRSRDMIAELRDAGSEDREIRLEWAKSIMNYVGHRAVEEPQCAREMIAELRDAGFEDQEIRLRWANSVSNYVLGCAAKEPQLARLMIAELRDAGFDDRDIRLAWAKSVVGYVHDRAAEEPQCALDFAWQLFGAAAGSFGSDEPKIGELALSVAIEAVSAAGPQSGRLLGMMTSLAPRLSLDATGGVKAQQFLRLMLRTFSLSTDASVDALLGPAVNEIVARWVVGDGALSEAFLWPIADPDSAESWFALAGTVLDTLNHQLLPAFTVRMRFLPHLAQTWHEHDLQPGPIAIRFYRLLLSLSADDPKLAEVIAPLAEIPPWCNQRPIDENELSSPA